MAKWSETAWKSAYYSFERMKILPFNTGLMNGTLPLESFKNYLQQDMIYLQNYGEEMKLICEMLTDHQTCPKPAIYPEAKTMFARLAAETVQNEKELHKLLSGYFDNMEEVQASEITSEYIRHTRTIVDSGDIALSLAALLPCFWVYNELGRYMHTNCVKENNPYLFWIETYSSESMDHCVSVMIDICDTLAAASTPEKRAQMSAAFLRSTLLEELFFAQKGLLI